MNSARTQAYSVPGEPTLHFDRLQSLRRGDCVRAQIPGPQHPHDRIVSLSRRSGPSRDVRSSHLRHQPNERCRTTRRRSDLDDGRLHHRPGQRADSSGELRNPANLWTRKTKPVNAPLRIPGRYIAIDRDGKRIDYPLGVGSNGHGSILAVSPLTDRLFFDDFRENVAGIRRTMRR